MNKLTELFKKQKPTPYIPADKMSVAIEEWSALYENKNQKCGNLNLASAICSELSRLVTLEFSSELSGSQRAEYLNEQYSEIIKKARIFTEFACAKGGVVLKPYLEGDKIKVSVIQADEFYPTSFTANGDLSGAVFYESFYDDGFYYTRFEEHKQTGNCVIIKNTAYKSKTRNMPEKEIPLNTVDRWADITPFCKMENIDRPLFAYFKMPMANTVDDNSSLGVSVYARATDLIRDAYSQYDNLLWEYESGKRALYLDECAVRRDEDSNVILPEKRIYRLLSSGNENLFEEWSPEIRNVQILSGLDRILRAIEFNCGLAYGTISDIQQTDKTAEEIRASKQRSYATVTDIQNALKDALKQLISIMDIYCDIYSLCDSGEYEATFMFDDSVITDRSQEFEERMKLLEKGVIKPWEMRVWYLAEEEKTAKERTEEGQ